MAGSTHIVISTANDLLRVRASDLLYIQADGNYSSLFLSGGEMKLVTLQLGIVEKILETQLLDTEYNFIRIGRSLIINLNFVFSINIPKQSLMLTDRGQGRYTLTASRDALTRLKELIESSVL